MTSVWPLHVAHVTATYPPYHGGTGSVVRQNAAELVRRGHAVDVLTANRSGVEPARQADPSDPDDAHASILVHRLPSFGRIGNAPLTPALAWRIRHYDLVHIHYPYFFGAELAVLGTVLANRPYVITYHQDVLFEGPLRHAERVHHQIMGRHLLAGAARVFVTSEDYGRASRIASVLDRMPDRVAALPNAVDTRRFRPDIDSRCLRSHYRLAPEDRVVLFTGALDRPHFFKGVPVLLEAIARIGDPSVRLLVVGDGDLREKYWEDARALGLSGRVIFCGRVSDEALPAHYALADVQVLPSTTMGEAFGVVLLEAMATGKPVIASRLPGVRTVVSEGEDGYLCTPGDVDDLVRCLRLILDDPAKSARMGAAGRAKVEAVYDVRFGGVRLERAYVDVLDARNQRALRPGREASVR